ILLRLIFTSTLLRTYITYWKDLPVMSKLMLDKSRCSFAIYRSLIFLRQQGGTNQQVKTREERKGLLCSSVNYSLKASCCSGHWRGGKKRKGQVRLIVLQLESMLMRFTPHYERTPLLRKNDCIQKKKRASGYSGLWTVSCCLLICRARIMRKFHFNFHTTRMPSKNRR
ncbi:Deoxyhypusine hydroxylase, partial [Frankliniella fusca]